MSWDHSLARAEECTGGIEGIEPMAGLPEFALHWATELGSKHSNLEELHGGINNRVYLCSAKGRKLVIKGYPLTKACQRDRMKAEVQFLKLANRVAPNLAPRLIYADQDHRCVVLEYLEGKAFAEGIPPQADAIATAVRFIKVLNRDSQLVKEYIEMDAAEGFLSLREHIANVSERLATLSCNHISNRSKSTARSLIVQIREELVKVQENTEKKIERGIVSNNIRPEERCVSPSDFGFHNAIITPKGVRFIDFEFAGWDDPAKTTVDFILQPHIPVRYQQSPLRAAWQPDLRGSIDNRCQYLGPILRLKWACIILSVLNPARLGKILSMASEERTGDLIHKRLERAGSYLERTGKIAMFLNRRDKIDREN